MIESYNLPDTIFHVVCNNFKVGHGPPGGNIFDIIEVIDCVEDTKESYIVSYEGDMEAEMSNIFS